MAQIRNFDRADFEAVTAIYRQGIETGNATFQTEPKAWPEWNATTLEACRLVAVEGDEVVGWAALAPVSGRCVYGGVAEVSVYVAERSRGQGLGCALLRELVAASERAGFWTLEAGIFPENAASIALHKKQGFRVVGIREKLGQLRGRWRDVVLLERRSTVSGA